MLGLFGSFHRYQCLLLIIKHLLLFPSENSNFLIILFAYFVIKYELSSTAIYFLGKNELQLIYDAFVRCFEHIFLSIILCICLNVLMPIDFVFEYLSKPFGLNRCLCVSCIFFKSTIFFFHFKFKYFRFSFKMYIIHIYRETLAGYCI